MQKYFKKINFSRLIVNLINWVNLGNCTNLFEAVDPQLKINILQIEPFPKLTFDNL